VAGFPADFRAVMLTRRPLSIRLVQAFAAALERPEDVFAAVYYDLPNQRIKIIRYPGRDQDEETHCVDAHKTAASSPSLFQGKARGLQVEMTDGWIEARPSPAPSSSTSASSWRWPRVAV